MIQRILQVEGAPPALGPYCHAVVAGGLVFTAGQLGLDPRTGEFVGPDVRAQTTQVFENLRSVLAAAGTSLDRAVKLTVYLADMKDFPAMNEVYATYFREGVPARSCFAVAGLPKGGRVEIDAVVALD
ncbi:MAG: RidA family protein [Planctomycetes bacterium]|nr:RidA family protein [Planctomycetota bacterium]